MQVTQLGVVVYGHGAYINDELAQLAEMYNVQVSHCCYPLVHERSH